MAWQRLSDGIAQARREMAARERRDIEQKEIAAAIGVSETAYSRWERGEREPREGTVKKLAKFFGVTPMYLRYGVEVPTLSGGRKIPRPSDDANDRGRAEGE